MSQSSEDWTLQRVTQTEADAICRWATRTRRPVKGPHGLPLATIGAYALHLAEGLVREGEFPVYADDEEMSPLLVLAGPRSAWEASGATGKIRPADITQMTL